MTNTFTSSTDILKYFSIDFDRTNLTVNEHPLFAHSHLHKYVILVLLFLK